MSKYLLVTADDFGMCHSVNAGILRAISQGIVRSTNFMVPCPWFSHAMHLAKEHRLLVGVHLCVTCDWDRYQWGPITRAESLRDDHGYFLPNHDAVAKQAKESDIHDELLAQIQRVKAMGYEPTHLDKMQPLGASERQTQTYKTAEFLAGREAGLKEGVAAAVAALRTELIRAGCTEDEIKHIVARVRAGAGQTK